MKKTIRLTESDIKRMVMEVLTEKVKSSELRNAIKDHGGLKRGDWSARWADLYNMSDEDFRKYQTVNPQDNLSYYGNFWDTKPLKFNDGTTMIRSDAFSKPWPDKTDYGLADKRAARRDAKDNDGAQEYQYENPYMNQLVNQGSRTYENPRGQWGIPGENSQNKGLGRRNGLNPMALRQKHIYATYGNDADSKVNDLWKGKYSENDLDKNIVGKAWNSRNQNVGDAVSEAVARAMRKYLR